MLIGRRHQETLEGPGLTGTKNCKFHMLAVASRSPRQAQGRPGPKIRNFICWTWSVGGLGRPRAAKSENCKFHMLAVGSRRTQKAQDRFRKSRSSRTPQNTILLWFLVQKGPNARYCCNFREPRCSKRPRSTILFPCLPIQEPQKSPKHDTVAILKILAPQKWPGARDCSHFCNCAWLKHAETMILLHQFKFMHFNSCPGA